MPLIIIITGMNLQICFMNEAASDSESSDSETCPKLSQGMSKRKNVQRSSSLMSHRTTAINNNSSPYNSRPLSVAKSVLERNEKGRVDFCEIFLSVMSVTGNFRSTSRHTQNTLCDWCEFLTVHTTNLFLLFRSNSTCNVDIEWRER